MSNSDNQIYRLAFPSIEGIVNNHIQISHNSLVCVGCNRFAYPDIPNPEMFGFEAVVRKGFEKGDGTVDIDQAYKSQRKWQSVETLFENLNYQTGLDLAIKKGKLDRMMVCYVISDDTIKFLYKPEGWNPNIG